MGTAKVIFVYADWIGLDGPVLMGRLQADVVRGREVFSFGYDSDWLDRPGTNALVLDPGLQFAGGAQFTEAPFGMLLDSAPGRWGRLLMERREALDARRESRKEIRLHDSDFLLGVADVGRLGGLRFRLAEDGPFLAKSDAWTIPPLHALRELERASLSFESGDIDHPGYAGWLRLLLAPGTSLGGARPKGSVMDPKGELWIAKFPSRQDEIDVGAWECLTYELASVAGLRTADARGECFSKMGTTFLIKRFDRQQVARIHYASAMTLLDCRDGDGEKTGASYLDLVDWITTQGAVVKDDLEELWKRIAFNVCVGNGDDHLRNHGFLLTPKGWRLSPVFDLNPQPWASGLAININETSNALDLDLVREVGEFFRVAPARQEALLKQIRDTIDQWEARARARKIPRDEIERMRPAFERFK